MVDFRQKLTAKQIQKPTDPIALYETLDRASDKGPLRPAQVAILKEWYKSRKNDRDIILKLHTGQGKTLIGLLMLQSKLNESIEPAVYLCPNNFLIDQTCSQAKQFGIRYCTAVDGDLPEEFYNGKSLLITSVQKLFNGRTKFKIGAHSLSVGYMLMDDAHACIDAIRDAFVIKLDKKSEGYAKLVDLFTGSLTSQGIGTFAEIKNGNKDSQLPVPYWDWHDKHAEVVNILSEMVTEESKKEKKGGIWFVWPLLKDLIQSCRCVVSGGTLEIAPYLPPLEVFGSFYKAKNRMFMSATVTNDAFLIKGLRLSPEVITKPLVYKEERWSGEKMILIPSLIHESLDRGSIVHEFGKVRTNRKFGVVALSPSFEMTADWGKYGSKVAKTETIGFLIEGLRQKSYDYTIVIANRYDGIDLPDNMCRILIFDSMPYSENLIDRYEEECRTNSEITSTRMARTIEQGLGRSVRGEKDYCAIILVGSELVKFVRNQNSRRHLSTQTRLQIQIGLDIADMAEQEIKSGKTPNEAFTGLLNQSLLRDEGWKDYYVEQMNQIAPEKISDQELNIFGLELEAEVAFQKGEYSRAVGALQTINDKYIKDSNDRYWYLQEMARMANPSSKTESNRYQAAAYKGNRYLMKPLTGVEFTKLQVVSQKRVEAIAAWIKAFENFEQLMLAVESIIGRLQFGTKFETFEQAIKELGVALGFSSERPCKEWKEGPDNLWCLTDGDYLLIESKNEVDLDRAEINKDETGQMNNACAWFKKYYTGATATRIMIIPPNRVGSAAGFVEEVHIMRAKELRALHFNLRKFFNEFKPYALNNLSENKIQEYLDAHKLDIDSIKSIYCVAVRDK
jgi:replicative superfamily II helicase